MWISKRIIPIFRCLGTLQGTAPLASASIGCPAPAIVDTYGALWTHDATAAQATQVNTFSIFATPAAATQATATKAAAGAGKRNILTQISASLNAVAAQGVVTLVVRDGASGVGTILWSVSLGPLLAGTSQPFSSPVNIVGSNNTAMTIEFTAAPAATNFETVAGSGIIAG